MRGTVPGTGKCLINASSCPHCCHQCYYYEGSFQTGSFSCQGLTLSSPKGSEVFSFALSTRLLIPSLLWLQGCRNVSRPLDHGW